MNILICPNSFKECADSVTIADIISEQLRNSTNHSFFVRPLTDGGDGFLKVCEKLFDINRVNLINIKNYIDNLDNNNLIYSNSGNRVFLESAELFGLRVIPISDRDPMRLNSAPLGKTIVNLCKLVSNKILEVDSVWIGVGGTATIDAGFGACSQLGLNFYDLHNDLLDAIPSNFERVTKLKFNKVTLPFKIKFIVDVDTELIGDPGALEIYGEQKGANEKDLINIKDGIKSILSLFQRDLGIQIPKKLNGAGGGLATGFSLLYDADIIPARKFIEDEILKDINLDDIDLVISGEGNFDLQSFEGKGSGVILDLFKDRKTKIILINGTTELPDNFIQSNNLTIINISEFFNSTEESIKNAKIGISKAAEIIKSQFNL